LIFKEAHKNADDHSSMKHHRIDQLRLPPSAEQLIKHPTALRSSGRDRQTEHRKASRSRKSPTPTQCIEVLVKTAKRCHISGGTIAAASWHADHVLSHNDGGAHSIDIWQRIRSPTITDGTTQRQSFNRS
jgi:hypothetical protein